MTAAPAPGDRVSLVDTTRRLRLLTGTVVEIEANGEYAVVDVDTEQSGNDVQTYGVPRRWVVAIASLSPARVTA